MGSERLRIDFDPAHVDPVVNKRAKYKSANKVGNDVSRFEEDSGLILEISKSWNTHVT